MRCLCFRQHGQLPEGPCLESTLALFWADSSRCLLNPSTKGGCRFLEVFLQGCKLEKAVPSKFQPVVGNFPLYLVSHHSFSFPKEK